MSRTPARRRRKLIQNNLILDQFYHLRLTPPAYPARPAGGLTPHHRLEASYSNELLRLLQAERISNHEHHQQPPPT